jgi:selenide, water dikinase
VLLPPGFPAWQRHLLTDPQTSGGLLVACARARAAEIVQSIREAGYPATRLIGAAETGASGVRIVA